jgi:hypothetical protein
MEFTAEYLNSIPQIQMIDQCVERVEIGQVWVAEGILFPLVVVYVDDATARVIPMYDVREVAASDDLFCDEQDGQFKNQVLAVWSWNSFPINKLKMCIGHISAGTIKLAQLIMKNGDVSRDRTGTSIVNRTDFRLDYRKWLIENVSSPIEKIGSEFYDS